MTDFLKDLVVDDPVEINAKYRFSDADRREIDNQIRDAQSALLDCLLVGAHATFVKLASTSAAVIEGDTVCACSTIGLTSPTVTKSTNADLVNAVGGFGVVMRAASPGQWCLVAFGGMVPPWITSLGTGAHGYVRINTTTGRCERVSTIGSSDYGIGTVDNAGWLRIAPALSSFATSGGEVNTASNLGTPSATVKGLYKQKVGVDIEFLSVEAGTGIALTDTGTTLKIDTTGVVGPTGNIGEIQINGGLGTFAAATNVKGGSNFISWGAAPPSVGTLRLSDGSSIVGMSAGITTALWWSGSSLSYGDRTLIVGADTNFDKTTMATAVYLWGRDIIDLGVGDGTGGATGGGFMQLDVSGWAVGPNVGLQGDNSGTPTYGGGIGVWYFRDASTVPGTNPSGGVIIYSESGNLKYRRPDGVIVPLKPLVNGTGISITENATNITISATGGGGGSSSGPAGRFQFADGSGGFTSSSAFHADTTSTFIATLGNGIELGGGTPSDTGLIRIPHVVGDRDIIVERNASGTGNWSLMSTNGGSSTVKFGDPTKNIITNLLGYSIVTQTAVGQSVDIEAGGDFGLQVSARKIEASGPIIGDTRASSPHGVHGRVDVTLTGDHTLTAAEYAYSVIHFTGALAADANVEVPVPSANTGGYWKTFVHMGSGNHVILKLAGGAGGTVATLNPGSGGANTKTGVLCFIDRAGVHPVAWFDNSGSTATTTPGAFPNWN